jgi:hypothetical protein
MNVALKMAVTQPLQRNYGLTKEQSRYVTSGQFNKDIEDMANTYGVDGAAKILRDGMDK